MYTNYAKFANENLEKDGGHIGTHILPEYRGRGYGNIIKLETLKKAKEMGIPVEKLVTHHYKLDEYIEAMEKNISLTGVKIAIVME